MGHATLDGLFTRVNQKLCKILGYTPGEMLNLTFHGITHPGDREAGLYAVKQLISGESESYAQEKRYRRKDGSLVWAHVTISLIRGANCTATYFIAMVEDISSRKACEAQQCRNIEADLRREILVRQKAEDELRRLSTRLLNLRDAEQRRIARDLHDSAGQIIAALGMNLAGVETHARFNPPLASALEDTQDLLRQLNREIRTTSYLLHPPLLDEAGLPGALRWYIDGIKKRSGLDVEFLVADDFDRLPADVELTLFRIVQESMTNIHRHSGSSRATIRLKRDASSVQLEVQDYGKGLPPESAPAPGLRPRTGVGMMGMRERVRHIGGKMTVESSAKGTTVCVKLPLTPVADPNVAATNS